MALVDLPVRAGQREWGTHCGRTENDQRWCGGTSVRVFAGVDTGEEDGHDPDHLERAGRLRERESVASASGSRARRQVRPARRRLRRRRAPVGAPGGAVRAWGAANRPGRGRRLGQAIANSPIFAEYGVTIAAIFDNDPGRVGRQLGQVRVSNSAQLGEIVRQRPIAFGVLAVPAASAQQVADQLVEAGVEIIFNYSEALLEVPDEIIVLTSNAAAELAAAFALQLG
jgi:CoA binding domain